MAPPSLALAAAAAAASPMVLTEQGRVDVGRRPVGVSWIGQEHLLVTSPSQVVLYSVSRSTDSRTWAGMHHSIKSTHPPMAQHQQQQIHDGGARLREWSFRPSKATAFTGPALAASQQGLLLGVQGQRRLVAWPDKASLTAAGAMGPEGMHAVEVGFPVARLVAAQGPVGVAWCVGAEGQLACYSTRAVPRVLAALGSSQEPQQQSRILASLASRRRPLLLVARADGSVQAFVAAAAAAAAAASATPDGASSATPPLRQSGAKAAEPPSPEAELRSSGLMWAGGSEESAYYWTVWSVPSGTVHVRVARVSFGAAATAQAAPALTLSVLYGKDVGASDAAAAGGGAGRKRRRSVEKEGAAAEAAEAVVGLEGEGALVVVDRVRGVLQAWDAEHGVVLGESAAVATEAAARQGQQQWVAGEGGVLAEAAAGEGGEVAVWRVEARAGKFGDGDGGLRRVLGKGAAASVSGTVMVLSGGVWVEAEAAAAEAAAAAAAEGGGRKKGKAAHAPQQGEEDEVAALLRLMTGAGGEQQQQSGQQEGKSGKARGVLARTPVSSRTALLVARRCLDDADEGGAAARGAKRPKSSGGGGNGNGTSEKGEQRPLWRLLGALLDAGKLPLRERPFLMEELLAHRRIDLVKRVLGGPADIPERAVVRALQRALMLAPAGEEEESGADRVAGSLELVALAVRRPCCPAFLRTALAAELDGPTAALLLVLLKVLLETAVKGGAKARPGEEPCLTWLEALLDANFVNLVLESNATSMAAASGAGRGGAVKQALEGVKALAGEAAAACQALETVGGYVAQFRRAGHAMEVIPDYSLDTLVI